MSDDQINALAGFEGRNPEDQETIAKQCFQIAELKVQLAEARKDAERWKKLQILGRVDSHGNLVWFADNPHAFPSCTEFFAMKQIDAAKGGE